MTGEPPTMPDCKLDVTGAPVIASSALFSLRPYYQDSLVTLYHGDSREIMPALKADVLVTDPPYGVGLGVGKDMRGGKHGLAKERYATYDDTYENFCAVVVPILETGISKTKRAAIFIGPHAKELPKWDAIGGVYNSAATGRHCWGYRSLHPVLLYGTAPEMNTRGPRATMFVSNELSPDNGHPCPKPLGWMTWLVSLAAGNDDVVLDPFAGSGTTLRAAKDLGRRVIGIEVEEKYCEISAKQCAQECLALGG